MRRILKLALLCIPWWMLVGVPSASAAFTACTSTSATSDTAVNNIAVTLSTTSGHLTVVFWKHEGTAGTVSTLTDSTGAITQGTQLSPGSGATTGFAYKLSSAVTGSNVFTVTWNATKTFRRVIVWDCPYTGIASFDVQPTGGGATATSNAPDSGNFTTTGTDEIVFGGYGEFTNAVFSAPKINSVAADASVLTATGGSVSWYKIETATFTGGSAHGTLATSQIWNCNAIAFKATSVSTCVPSMTTLHASMGSCG